MAIFCSSDCHTRSCRRESYVVVKQSSFESTLQGQPFQLAQLRQFKLKDRIYVQVKEILAPLMTITINNFIHLFSRVIILEVILVFLD